MDNKRSFPRLCDADDCTACAACYNVCPKQAIEMNEDACGEAHPVIDEDKCIKCQLCERVCPSLKTTTLKRNGKPTVYSCWLKDAGLRQDSTSGGAAFAIAQAIINKGGHVWGAAYDEQMDVRYVEASTIEALAAIQKSKYVQSNVHDAFRSIKKLLEQGVPVLFAGTGCHVMGLKSYLRKEYPNLFTLDLVCHGVPGAGVFRKYRKWLEDRFEDKMLSYVPRPKRKSDGQEMGYYSLATFEHKGDVKLEGRDNAYFVGFQHNLFLRSACFHCQANGEERYADFTVADFWGIGKVAPFKPYQERTKGISMLALNTDKARMLFEDFKDELVYELRSYKEASFTNTQYYRPAKPSPRREAFRQDFPRMSWESLATKYMQRTYKETVLYYIKKFTPPHLLLYAKLLAKWIK